MKGKSCKDAWEYVKRTLSECENKYVIELFVDFKGGFSNLLRGVILDKLCEIEYPADKL